MIISDYHFPECPKNVICFQGENITDSLIEECFKLDNNFFDEKYLYNRAKMTKLIKKHSELCLVFYDLEINKVIGYNFLFLLKNSSYELYKKSAISYFTMGEIDIADLKKDKTATLFYLSTAYTQNDKIVDLLSLAQNYIVFLLTNLKNRYGIKITNLLFDVVNEFDSRYVSILNLEYFKDTAYQSKIFTKVFNPTTFYPYAIYTDRLVEAYKN